MRVIIYADMEGTAGISVWEQVLKDKSMYAESRLLMTEEVNAAVRGAKKAGAREIVVVDSHGAGQEYSFRSLIPDRLETGAEYVFGSKYLAYVEPLRQGCHAAICTGAHAISGSLTGNLSHTVSTRWLNAYINEQPVGEVAITAALCGHFNCPIAFVSGDDITCNDAITLLGNDLTTAVVKKGLDRFAIRTLSPREAREKIEEGVCQALSRKQLPLPFKPTTPVTLTVEFTAPDEAATYANRPGVQRIDERKLQTQASDFFELWTRFYLGA